MPKYFYTAAKIGGEKESGILEAKDLNHLIQLLKERNLILIRAEIEGKKEKKFKISFPSFGVSLTEKLFFTRNLLMMISAALSLPKAIEILSNQTKNKKFKLALIEIKEEIQKGKSFSDSIAKYPEIFSEIYQGMIKVGEESGTLEDVLKTLTTQMEREHDLKSKIKGAMIYPAVVVSAMIGIGILMLIMVIPKLAETFKELNVELPATTRFVISLAEFLSQRWYLLLSFLIFFVFFFRWALRQKNIKRAFDSLTLKIPVLSSIIKKLNCAYTSRTLSSLISAGVPIVSALEITSRALGNEYYKKALLDSSEKVKKGEKMSEALISYSKFYPETFIQMIAVGEETGQTAQILAKLADFYEEEVSNAAKNLSSLIEPILILIIGVVIGFFAVAMIQPMYSMLGAIK
jgi:type IV pilus assembly protein PilC